MNEPVEHRMVDVRPMFGRAPRGFVVHCSCGWTSRVISTAGMATGVHDQHKADPDAVSDGYR